MYQRETLKPRNAFMKKKMQIIKEKGVEKIILIEIGDRFPHTEIVDVITGFIDEQKEKEIMAWKREKELKVEDFQTTLL